MELRRLRYFIAAAEEVHFRRAARRLHISEPALGFQIRQLEREIGFELFQRLHQRVRLTAAGKQLLIDARRVMDDVEKAVSQAGAVARGEAGFLRVGHLPWTQLRAQSVGSLIPVFSARYPTVNVQAVELTCEG